jgi:hypothetical protein
MICNRHRGEICAALDGKDYRLCLTLGALAELESAFGSSDLQSLVERLSTGRLSALDMVRIIGAGLRGAGNNIADADVSSMTAEGSAAGFARIVAELVTATFSTPGEQMKAATQPDP